MLNMSPAAHSWGREQNAQRLLAEMLSAGCGAGHDVLETHSWEQFSANSDVSASLLSECLTDLGRFGPRVGMPGQCWSASVRIGQKLSEIDRRAQD